ncbi:hypothetical protein GE061_017839 [Apolygus lucorum]|uniref:C-type lectin domain-containing protein n=1 Tax=Apolygus lucorum TaxID=248454 RepID=A0A8S9XCA3_APOLU|nr:hypothetical protein GE061_017839 [Apolygus lucorum]
MKALALRWYCLIFLLLGPQAGKTNPADVGELKIVTNEEQVEIKKVNSTKNIVLTSSHTNGSVNLMDLLKVLQSMPKDGQQQTPNCNKTLVPEKLEKPGKCDSEKKKFQIIHTKLSWHNALIYCKEKRMELASVRNLEEHNKMLQEINKAGSIGNMFWIGGTKLHSSRGYFWISDGEQVSYFNWLRGQPDNFLASQHCTSYLNGWGSDTRWGWDDNWCDSAIFFACEYC